MTRDELRLELLKLTYVHGREAAEAVRRAKELESYVQELEKFEPIKEPVLAPDQSEKRKKSGKSDSLN